MQHARVVLVLLVLAFAVAPLGDAAPAAGQARPVALVSALGRCLDVASGNSGNGASLQLWDCNGTPAQQWIIEGTQIRSGLGRCLDTAAGNSGNGGSIQLRDCNGTPAQQWTGMLPGALHNGLGMCLDVSAANSGNGASIQVYSCNGTPAQTWIAR